MRQRIARLLLLVYVPMMLAVTLHHYGEARQHSPAIQCQDCARHVHHEGHLMTLQHAAHDCVLCQLQGTQYLVPVSQALVTFTMLHLLNREPSRIRCRMRANEAKNTRAPPLLLHPVKT